MSIRGTCLQLGLLIALGLLPSAAFCSETIPSSKQIVPAEFSSSNQGVALGLQVETGIFAYAGTLEAGLQTSGIKSLQGKALLLQWDLELAAKGGALANAHPYTPLIGGRARSGGEIGYRLMPTQSLSPYVGLAAQGAAQALFVPGVPPSKMNTLNNMDGVAGVNASASARWNIGGSYLDEKNSVLLLAFVQKALRAPATNTPGAAFNEVGVHAQYDVAQKLNLQLEALYGKTGENRNSAFNSTQQSTHKEIALRLVKTFDSGLWFNTLAQLSQESHRTIYSGSANGQFDSAEPIHPSLSLNLGVPIP